MKDHGKENTDISIQKRPKPVYSSGLSGEQLQTYSYTLQS
jgi:hypothetical protein